MSRTPNREASKKGAWIGPAVVLLLTTPELIPIAIFGGIIWLVIQAVSRQQSTPKSSTRTSARQEKFDECPQPFFCFHRDKGEHHVRRGKEIDPWDRPDIDISKYQQNR